MRFLGLHRLAMEVLESRVVPAGSGLAAQYFHNDDFTGLAFDNLEAIDFDWGYGSPTLGVAPQDYSVRWNGQVEPAFTETYSFVVESAGGARLWVDGQLLVDEWDVHTWRAHSGSIDVVAGQKYDLRVEFFQEIRAAAVRLSWASNSQPAQVIPAERLYVSPNGLLGQYADDAGNRLTQVEPQIDFDWGTGSPASMIDADHFGVSYTGQVQADFGEEYTFGVDSAGPARLWVGNELIVDNWTEHTTTTNTGVKTLEPGKWNDIRLEIRDETGTAEVVLRWSSPRQTGVGIYQTVPTSNLRASLATPLTFANPLGPGADPFVVQWQNSYLLVRSQGRSVWIDRAEQLQNIHQYDSESTSVVAWTAPSGTSYSEQIWAPELHHLDGKWYIYVAASDGDNATHRMHVLEHDDPNPMGPFVYKGQINSATDRWAIDGTVLQWQGVRYFVWSGWPGFFNGQQNLYIAEMRNPWSLVADRVLLSTPQYSWEQFGLRVNEGPQVLIHDGNLHIIYSGSGFWRPEYALGRLTYDGTGSLLDSTNWSKVATPVFHRTSEVVGTGHASFVKSPDGTEDWIVYHAHEDPNHFEDNRVVRIQPFTYSTAGTPDFGVPLPPATVLSAPSGAADADAPLINGDYDTSGQVNEADYEVWLATFGQIVFPGSGADGNGNGIVDAADYTVWRDNQGDENETTSMLVPADMRTVRRISPPQLPPDLPSVVRPRLVTACSSKAVDRVLARDEQRDLLKSDLCLFLEEWRRL